MWFHSVDCFGFGLSIFRRFVGPNPV
jgi:hypothetical protein